MGLIQNLKERVRLAGFAWVLSKVDVEKIVDQIENFGEKSFPRGKEDFTRFCYYKLLELVSALNRRMKKI